MTAPQQALYPAAAVFLQKGRCRIVMASLSRYCAGAAPQSRSVRVCKTIDGIAKPSDRDLL